MVIVLLWLVGACLVVLFIRGAPEDSERGSHTGDYDDDDNS